MEDNTVVKEWLDKAGKDLSEAEFLYENNRPLDDVGFFIQQSAEKYLKGYLLSHGWHLQKIHDLVVLGREAAGYDKSFEDFISFLRKAARFYFESRYPMGYALEYTSEEMKEALEQLRKLADLVKKNIKDLK